VRRHVLLAVLAATVVGVLATPAHGVQTEPLAEGPVMALPPGDSFLSIVSLPQPPGESFGPHGHVPGFVYALDGTVRITDDASTLDLSKGEGHFIPALAAHTHENAADRLPAGAVAMGLIVAVAILSIAARVPGTRVALVPALLVLIIAGGALALWNPWKNDWFFYGIRPEAARGAVMPLPNASRTYESPTLANVPDGPYVESLATVTLGPNEEVPASLAPGPTVFLVLDGRADVIVGNEERARLGHHEATLVQAGENFGIRNLSGDGDLRLLRFALTPESG
jgi:mannose-6-phosphate isomerase-like protein (cupin superfamily)